MKKIFILFFTATSTLIGMAQSVGIGTNTPHATAALDITSTSKGILIPRMTSDQRTSIASPPNGLLVFDTDAGGFYFYKNGDWTSLSEGGAANSFWSQNGTNITNTNAGNVMIGVGDPFSKFTVSADQVGFTQQTTNGQVKVGFYTHPSQGAYIQTHSNHPLNFSSNNGAAHMTILPSGKVGIGTATPTSMFHVTGGTSLFGGPVQLTNGLQISSGTPGDGKILTSDATGNVSWQAPLNNTKVGFHVRGIVPGGAGVLAPETFNKIHFETKATDYGSDYLMINGTPSSSFIAPVNGFYHFDATLNLIDFSTTEIGGIPANAYTYVEMRLQLKRGNSTITLLSHKTKPAQNTETTEALGFSLSTDVRLLAGDVIWVELKQDNIQNKNGVLDHDPESASFSGHLIYKD